MLKRSLMLSMSCLFAFGLTACAENVRETPVVKVIQKCAPMVVNISTEQKLTLQQNPFWGVYGSQLDAFHANNLQQFTQNLGTVTTQSLGSGVIVSEDGLIVTNAHVAGMASKIFVTLQNGETKEAKLIGMDNHNDLALIQIPTTKPLDHIEMADAPIIGETVVTIGNPLGLQNSVSAGIVSGTGRTFTANPPATQVFRDLIQTDASINQGSSGGALIDMEGKLLGINFAVVQNAQGLGFAVPAEKVKNMLAEYRKILAEKKKEK